MVTKTQPQIKPQWYDCDACDDGFEASTPPEPGRKLYEIHGCFKGKRKAHFDAIACKHCAALTGGLRCGCPEAVAQLKASDEASNKKNKEFELSHARFEQERADKQRKADEGRAENMREIFDAGRKNAQRTKRVTDLEDRELAQKEIAMTRREASQRAAEAADTDEAQVEDADEPLAAFEMPMDGSDLDLAPIAMLTKRRRGPALRRQAQFPVWDAWLRQILGSPALCP